MEKLKSTIPATLKRRISESKADDLNSTSSSLDEFLNSLPLFHQLIDNLTKRGLCCKNEAAAMEAKRKGNECFLKGEYSDALGFYSQLAHFGLCFLSKLVHLVVSIWYLLVGVVDVLESYLIAFGWPRKYRSLDINKVRYLAIVVESEDANQISDVIRLLQWVAAMGIKKLCLYDMEGVLKKSKDAILSKCNADLSQGFDVGKPPSDGSRLTLEFTSLPDGKERVAKAANYLFMKHLELKSNGEIIEKPNFTKSLMDEALKVVGCTGPDPDLLLVYGPARCHLGYPPWRIRYTEIVHMGPLKSMKYGSLIKVVRKFTTVRQNYGK